ncbi:helix-turn-helix domain-containing protein [Rhodocytophaga rosea]|uniref:Helix-turn-helix domain-containing protein n=1 Tax=Rhodocytophaga rosea TaxID=2704465 RepID=A0A6C0GW19_9BACT|nr:pentapeptide repeat-containing protein [Rhodocytophaga rosea]QHT71480.1 helix-turn-helix domain-containing protein [Rhodocytophaga rosea]
MLHSKSIGNKIALARKKHNLSQAELAQQVSISPQAVGKWERGESMPDISTLNHLAEILKVDLNYFSESFHSDNPDVSTSRSAQTTIDENQTFKPKKKFGWNWDMSKGNWVDVDLSGLKDVQEKLDSSNLKNCKFMGSDLSGILLKSNSIEKCDFTGTDLRNSKIQSSSLKDTKFDNCSLIDAEFSKTSVKNCSFSSTNFSGAEFFGANFQSSIVENAVWKHTSFKETAISDIVFQGLMEDCAFEFCAFSKVVFKNMTLKHTFFKCKTLKKIQFINCEADRITYELLKSGKADLSGVSLIA